MTPWQRAGTMLDAVLQTIAAFERKPGELTLLRRIGRGVAAVTSHLATSTRSLWMLPSAILRGVVRLAGAFDDLILKHIEDEDVKNLKTVGDATDYILKHQA